MESVVADTNALTKKSGGLGCQEDQRAIWIMSSIVSSYYNLAMQNLTANGYTTGEQYKESTSRASRDEADLGKVAAELGGFAPDCVIESQELLQMRLLIHMISSQNEMT